MFSQWAQFKGLLLSLCWRHVSDREIYAKVTFLLVLGDTAI